MRISCGTQWAERLALHEAVKLISQAGYAGIDLAASSAEAMGEQALSHTLNESSLVPASVTVRMGPDADSDIARVAAGAELARSLGLGAIAIVASDRRQQSLASWTKQLERVLEQVPSCEIELTNRYGSRLEQLGDFRETFVHLPDPRLRVVVNTLEFHRASVDPRGAVDELADRLSRLIVADAIGDRQVPLGEGEVNVASVLPHAERAGRMSWLSVRPPVTSRDTAVDDLAGERKRLERLLQRSS